MDESGASRSPEEIPAAPPARWRQQKHRGLLWLCFWILFLTTPATPFALGFVARLGPQGIPPFAPVLVMGGGLLAGIGGAGFILARLYSNTTPQLVARTLAFAFLIALVYGFIAFAGCMMLLKGI
jgi:hypothetical protein